MTKRMLVTGGAGFIAHHVIDHFLKTRLGNRFPRSS